MACVCGKGESLETCCGPYLKGEAQPDTAEALMRARYAAYALGNIDYILSSHDPDNVKDVDRGNTEQWSKNSTWLGLEILKTERGQPEDDQGSVDFVARYNAAWRLERLGYLSPLDYRARHLQQESRAA